MSSDSNKQKVIKDRIYGHIIIPSLCQKFIDVSEFQRLRRVTQLGSTKYVYPTCTHTRFEHSIGCMHLAGLWIEQLKKYKLIDDRTKGLIQLAALYHDVGHFSFSHLFDDFLANTVLDQDVIDPIFMIKHHEDRSIYILKKVNQRLQLLTDEEVEFITCCITGKVLDGYPPYLFEICSNTIDVDRMDYIGRDAYCCGLPAFQFNYIILNMVITDSLHIAFRKKATRDIQDFFDTRKRMYENVYYHPAARKIDRIYYCMMKRLGVEMFQFGEFTDDYNIESLFRSHDKTKELIEQLDTRQLDHSCSICSEYQLVKEIKHLNDVNLVGFV